MKTYIRRKEKNDSLVVLYGAWGTDENTYISLYSDDFDFILFYNYSADQALVLPEMKTYRKITMIGWSLGVWAAEFLSPSTGIIPDVTIAVNGTPIPADDHYGISLKWFEDLLDNITEESMNNYYFSMFGNRETYNRHSGKIPHRTPKSLNIELRWLYNRIMEQKEPGYKWDFAVMSESDMIYPPENVINYWNNEENTKQILLPYPHYMFYKWNSFGDFIDFVEKYGKKNIAGQNSRQVRSEVFDKNIRI